MLVTFSMAIAIRLHRPLGDRLGERFGQIWQSRSRVRAPPGRFALTRILPVYTTAIAYAVSPRRGGRVAEGGGLLNRYRGLNPYRGFESPSLRQYALSALKSLGPDETLHASGGAS